MAVWRFPLVILSLFTLLLFAAVGPPVDWAQALGSCRVFAQMSAGSSLDELPPQPWPQPYHDAGRTSRSSIVGPQSGTVKYVYSPPSGWFYFVDLLDITIARSGRAFVGVEHCFWYPEGCLGFYDTIALLRPDGTARLLPLNVRHRYFNAPVISADGTLYARSEQGLTALTPLGQVKWTSSGAGLPTLGPDGTIYAFAGPDLIALDPGGTVKWTTRLPDDPFTPLAIGPYGNFY